MFTKMTIYITIMVTMMMMIMIVIMMILEPHKRIECKQSSTHRCSAAGIGLASNPMCSRITVMVLA
jgi:hypothetical protein